MRLGRLGGRGRSSALMGFGPPSNGAFPGGPPLPHGIPVSNSPGYDQNLALSGQLLRQLHDQRAAQSGPPPSAPVTRPSAPSPQDLYNSQSGARQAARDAMEQMAGKQKDREQQHQWDVEKAKQAHLDRMAEQAAVNDPKNQINRDKGTALAKFHADQNDLLKQNIAIRQKLADGTITAEQARTALGQNELDLKRSTVAFNQAHGNDVEAVNAADKGVPFKATPTTVQPAGTSPQSPATALPGNTVQPGKKLQDAPNIPNGVGSPQATVQPVTPVTRDANGDFVQPSTPSPAGTPAPGAIVTPSDGQAAAPLGTRKDRQLDSTNARGQQATGDLADMLLRKAQLGGGTTTDIVDRLNREIAVSRAGLQPQDESNPVIANEMAGLGHHTTTGFKTGTTAFGGLRLSLPSSSDRAAAYNDFKTNTAGERSALENKLKPQGGNIEDLTSALEARRDTLTKPPEGVTPQQLQQAIDARANGGVGPALPAGVGDKLEQYLQYQKDQSARANPAADNNTFGKGFTDSSTGQLLTHPLDTLGNMVSNSVGGKLIRGETPSLSDVANTIPGVAPLRGILNAGDRIGTKINKGENISAAGDFAGEMLPYLLPVAAKGTGNALSTVGEGMVNNTRPGIFRMAGAAAKYAGDKLGGGTVPPEEPGASNPVTPSPSEPNSPAGAASQVLQKYKNLSPNQVRAMEQMGIPEAQIARADATAAPSVSPPETATPTTADPVTETPTTDTGATDAASAAKDALNKYTRPLQPDEVQGLRTKTPDPDLRAAQQAVKDQYPGSANSYDPKTVTATPERPAPGLSEAGEADWQTNQNNRIQGQDTGQPPVELGGTPEELDAQRSQDWNAQRGGGQNDLYGNPADDLSSPSSRGGDMPQSGMTPAELRRLMGFPAEDDTGATV